MSKATKHNVASITKDGKTIHFDRSSSPSIWGALAAMDRAEKANAPR